MTAKELVAFEVARELLVRHLLHGVLRAAALGRLIVAACRAHPHARLLLRGAVDDLAAKLLLAALEVTLVRVVVLRMHRRERRAGRRRCEEVRLAAVEPRRVRRARAEEV